MKSKRLQWYLVLAFVLLAIIAAWFWRVEQESIEANAIDLVELFPDAQKRTTMGSLEEGYAITTVTIDNDRKRSIFAHPFSRITWKVTIPPRAVLRTAAAIRPDAWSGPGDGALFRVGVSDGREYREFFKQMIQPSERPSDRRWFPIEIDLSSYADREVEIIFNTEPGVTGNAVTDACVWGAPRVVPLATGTESP